MIKIPRIKLQWATAKTTPGDWYLGLIGIYKRGTTRSRGVALSLRGLLAWSCVFAAFAYAGVAAYVWWKLEQRPYNFVKYTDMLAYPLKKKEIDELRGQALIAEGMDSLKEQRWGDAMMKLRVGLDKYPRDLKARLEVTRFFLAAKVRPRAQAMLLGGLDYGWPGRYYLENAIAVAGAGEDQELIIEFCDRALSLYDPTRHPVADRRWLVEQRARALLQERRFEEVLATLQEHEAILGDELRSEFRLVALLQDNRVEEAVVFAEAWFERSPRSPQVHRLLARSYREAGRLDDMTRILAATRALEPASPRALVFAFIQNFLAGADDAGRQLLDDFIFRFGGTIDNFILAAEPLGEIGRVAEVDHLINAAAERGMKDARLRSARLQGLVNGARWTEAAREIDNVRAMLSPEALSRAAMLDILSLLIAAASDSAEAAQSGIVDHVRQRQFPLSVYRQLIEALRKAGRIDTARRIATFGEGVYPANRYIADTIKTLDDAIEARRLAEEAARPVAASRPELQSAKLFQAELTRQRSDSPEAALRLIYDLRQARPDWAKEEGPALDLAELEIQSQRQDAAALQGAVRRYLANERTRIRETLRVASETFNAGNPENARLILNEVLRRIPDEPSATSLRQRLFPPPPPETETAPVP